MFIQPQMPVPQLSFNGGSPDWNPMGGGQSVVPFNPSMGNPTVSPLPFPPMGGGMTNAAMPVKGSGKRRFNTNPQNPATQRSTAPGNNITSAVPDQMINQTGPISNKQVAYDPIQTLLQHYTNLTGGGLMALGNPMGGINPSQTIGLMGAYKNAAMPMGMPPTTAGPGPMGNSPIGPYGRQFPQNPYLSPMRMMMFRNLFGSM